MTNTQVTLGRLKQTPWTCTWNESDGTRLQEVVADILTWNYMDTTQIYDP